MRGADAPHLNNIRLPLIARRQRDQQPQPLLHCRFAAALPPLPDKEADHHRRQAPFSGVEAIRKDRSSTNRAVHEPHCRTRWAIRLHQAASTRQEQPQPRLLIHLAVDVTSAGQAPHWRLTPMRPAMPSFPSTTTDDRSPRRLDGQMLGPQRCPGIAGVRQQDHNVRSSPISAIWPPGKAERRTAV